MTTIMNLRIDCAVQQTKVEQIVGLPWHSFLLLESAMSADYQEAPIPRRSLFYSFGLLHVGTATKSVRQYRWQMARVGRASATEAHRAWQQRSLATLLHR